MIVLCDPSLFRLILPKRDQVISLRPVSAEAFFQS